MCKPRNRYPPKPEDRLLLWVDPKTPRGETSSGREQREKQTTKISRSLPCRCCCKEISGQTYVGASVVVDGSLGHHGVVLELRLAERRSVGRDEDELGLAGAEGLEGAAVAEDDLAGLDDKGELFERASSSAFLVFSIVVDSADFAHGDFKSFEKRTLAPMLWASDLDFLGAIANDLSVN